MKRVSREQIKKSMQEKIARREPIILAGAGCGLVARAEEAGADLIMAYNTGAYRMDGHVSLVGYRYYSDGNKDTLELAAQLCDTVKKTPVAAGVCAEDPFRDQERLLEQLMELGYNGVTNVPSIAGAAEKAGSVFGLPARGWGMGTQAELELVRLCRRKGIFTAMYAYNEADIKALTAAGVDLLSIHVGGHGRRHHRGAGGKAVLAGAGRGDDAALLRNGAAGGSGSGGGHPRGAFEDPQAMEYCFSHAACHGYIGASGIERIPVEKALRRAFAGCRALRTG